MDKENNNILIFREKPENIKKKIEKICKAAEVQANNLDIILSQCVIENDYIILYEYLTSEIEFRGGLYKFCEQIKMTPDCLRKFLHSEKEPSLSILTKVLNGLGFAIRITNKP